MSTLADRTIAALRANHDDLEAVVGRLSDADLARQSGAEKWDVAAVLSHLGSGAEIGLASLTAGITGDDPPGQDANQSIWDRWNAMTAHQRADGFVAANERLVSAYEGLDDTARSDLRVTLGFLPAPADVALLSGMRLSEAAQHGWDVRVAGDPQAAIPPVEAEVAIDQLVGPLSFLVGFTGKSEPLGSIETTLRIETTDPQRSFGLVLGPAINFREAPDDADGVLRLPAESALRLFGGRLGPTHTPITVTLDSTAVTLDTLRAVFPGY